jgi:hypothetical protein
MFEFGYTQEVRESPGEIRFQAHSGHRRGQQLFDYGVINETTS